MPESTGRSVSTGRQRVQQPDGGAQRWSHDIFEMGCASSPGNGDGGVDRRRRGKSALFAQAPSGWVEHGALRRGRPSPPGAVQPQSSTGLTPKKWGSAAWTTWLTRYLRCVPCLAMQPLAQDGKGTLVEVARCPFPPAAFSHSFFSADIVEEAGFPFSQLPWKHVRSHFLPFFPTRLSRGGCRHGVFVRPAGASPPEVCVAYQRLYKWRKEVVHQSYKCDM